MIDDLPQLVVVDLALSGILVSWQLMAKWANLGCAMVLLWECYGL